MKSVERKYLRAAHFHFKGLLESRRLSLDHDVILDQLKAGKLLYEIVYHVLCLEGDMDGQSEDDLKELFEEHNIKTLPTP